MDLSQHLFNLHLLTCVIDAGSFSKAAEELGTTRSLLSRRITALEKALGVRLLYRDSRRFAVTNEGEEVYKHALEMSKAAKVALNICNSDNQDKTFRLHIGLEDTLLCLASKLISNYAKVTISTQLKVSSYKNHDSLLRQQISVALHLGDNLPNSADIVAHLIGYTQLVIVGTPELINELGNPKHPQDVNENYRLSCLTELNKKQWIFNSELTYSTSTKLASDQLGVMLKLASDSLGLVQIPLYACKNKLTEGELVRVFEKYEPTPLPLYALTLSGSSTNSIEYRFVHFIKNWLTQQLDIGILPAG